MSKRLSTKALHEKFLDALGLDVIHSGDTLKKPLLIELRHPLPPKVRLYIYNMTDPPGGRTIGEMKIQLILPEHKNGNRASFDESGVSLVLLVGYNLNADVFVFWDAGMYHDISYSRNVQTYSETVNSAVAGEVAEKRRNLRGVGWEVSIAVRSDKLAEGIQKRVQRTIERVSGEYTDG